MRISRSLLVLLLLAGNTHAEVLYRCVSGTGAVSWQATPCAKGMRIMKTIEYTPDAPAAVPVPDIKRTTTTRSTSRASTRYRVSARTIRSKPDACARARQQREATLQRVGLKRTYDLLSKLDADVRAVCR